MTKFSLLVIIPQHVMDGMSYTCTFLFFSSFTSLSPLSSSFLSLPPPLFLRMWHSILADDAMHEGHHGAPNGIQESLILHIPSPLSSSSFSSPPSPPPPLSPSLSLSLSFVSSYVCGTVPSLMMQCMKVIMELRMAYKNLSSFISPLPSPLSSSSFSSPPSPPPPLSPLSSPLPLSSHVFVLQCPR